MLRTSKLCLRTFAVSTRLRNVGPVLQNTADITKLLNDSTWAVKDLIRQTQRDGENIEIDSLTAKKILKLSGFKTDISKLEEEAVISALMSQMVFIKHLYEDDSAVHHKEKSNDSHFRLMASDHIPQEPLTLLKLLESIETLKVDTEKGETPESFEIKQLNERHGTHFVISSEGDR